MLLLGTDHQTHVKYQNNGENAEYWAERGLIHFYNFADVNAEGKPRYGTVSIRDMADRLKGLNDMIGNSKRPDGGYHMPDEVNKLKTFIEQMIVLCRVAQSQGDPTNVRAVHQRADEAMKRVQSQAIALGTATYTGHKGTIYTSPPPAVLPSRYTF